MDEHSGKGTLHVHKGGPIDHSISRGGNTMNFDNTGAVVSIVYANPVATMNMNMTGFVGDDRVAAYRLMQHYTLFAKKPAG